MIILFHRSFLHLFSLHDFPGEVALFLEEALVITAGERREGSGIRIERLPCLRPDRAC